MRKTFRRFLSWAYVKYVVLPDFKDKVEVVEEARNLLVGMMMDEIGEDYDIEFEPDESFQAMLNRPEKLN
jgi:hypothetical protein